MVFLELHPTPITVTKLNTKKKLGAIKNSFSAGKPVLLFLISHLGENDVIPPPKAFWDTNFTHPGRLWNNLRHTAHALGNFHHTEHAPPAVFLKRSHENLAT